MLSRISKLPLPPVFGCALTQSPSSLLALRFMETKLTNDQIKAILFCNGKKLLGDGYIMISNQSSGVVAVVPPETNKRQMMADLDSYALQLKGQ